MEATLLQKLLKAKAITRCKSTQVNVRGFIAFKVRGILSVGSTGKG